MHGQTVGHRAAQAKGLSRILATSCATTHISMQLKTRTVFCRNAGQLALRRLQPAFLLGYPRGLDPVDRIEFGHGF